MLLMTPNFHFSGQCKQAIALYESAFGAIVTCLLHYSDANPADWAMGRNDEKELVYHAEMMIGSQRIILSDATGGALAMGNSLSLVVTFDTADEVKAALASLSDGATIISPMTSTTYSSCFVSLLDKFGMRWELMTEQIAR